MGILGFFLTDFCGNSTECIAVETYFAYTGDTQADNTINQGTEKQGYQSKIINADNRNPGFFRNWFFCGNSTECTAVETYFV